jgi:uncharacterized protein
MTSTEAGSRAGIALLDVNVLIALHDEAHLHHQPARAWMASQGGAPWATCPLTQNGCLRILCQPSYPNPFTFREAQAMLTDSCEHETHRFLPDDISLLDATRVHHAHIHGHRQLTDLYLLALAVKHGGRLVSFDARIPLSAVHGAQPHHLVQI